jgi:hypothetical protein
MGSSAADKASKTATQNKLGNISDTAGNRSETIYNAGRGDVDFARTGYKDLYNSLGEDGGGGGGGYNYTPASFESSSLPFYQKLMNEGGYDETTRGAMESSASAPVRAIFEGLGRNLNTMSAGRGLGVGSGLSRLAREGAYSASEANKSAFGDIQKMVLDSKMAGAGGVTGLESEKRSFEESERSRAAAAAASRNRAADDDYNKKRQLLADILGIEGDRDISYQGNQIGATMGGIPGPKDNSGRNAAIGGGLAAAGTVAAALI